MVVSTSSARNDFLFVTTATAVLLFFFCNPMLCVTGAWVLTGTSSSSSNPSLAREVQRRRNHIIFTTSTINTARTVSTTSLKAKDDRAKETSSSLDIDSIKAQLTEYLAKRKEIGADELAKKEIGKIVGGTKGNKILEYVSAAPNKAVVVEDAPNPLDYDELTRYGYGHLVTPIMNFGGRLAMYRLLGMDPPPLSSSSSRKKNTYDTPKLVIDKTGATDKARYSGLKLGQVINDSIQAAALENVQRKIKNGQELRRKLQEEDYIPPFADKRNIGPRQTPDWTPELLDEMGKKQGRVEAWARRAKAGAFVNDPMETLDLSLQQRVFSIVTALIVATAFGKSTNTFLTQTTHLMSPVSGGDDTSSAVAVDAILHVLQAPAVGLLVAAIGSMMYCVLDSRQKNRNPLVWAVKGLLGGPISVRLLRELQPLLTNEETDNNNANKKQEKDAPN